MTRFGATKESATFTAGWGEGFGLEASPVARFRTSLTGRAPPRPGSEWMGPGAQSGSGSEGWVRRPGLNPLASALGRQPRETSGGEPQGRELERGSSGAAA